MKQLVLAALIVALAAACTHAEEDWAARRAKLVQVVKAQGISDENVLKALGEVPRHLFVPGALQHWAYNDHPLPIGHDQTISQPYIVAYMTQVLKLKGTEKVLEVGTGSGYQAAIVAKIVPKVYSVEIICDLAKTADERLKKLGFTNIEVKCGDGYQGWKEHAPFDAILVTAAPDHVPQPLVDQLAPGGRMVLPVGKYFQDLRLIEKSEKGVVDKSLIPVAFVPMTGPGVEHKGEKKEGETKEKEQDKGAKTSDDQK